MADFDPSHNPSPGARPPLAPLPPRSGPAAAPVSDADFARPLVSANGVVSLCLGLLSAGIILLPGGGGWYLAPFLGAAAWYLGHRGMGRIARGEADFRETYTARRGRLIGIVMTVVGGLYVLVHIFIWGVFTFVRRPFAQPPPSATTPSRFPPGFDQYGRPILPPGAVVTHQWSHTGPPNHGHAPKH